MLISCNQMLLYMPVSVKGIIHVGAHACEERQEYSDVLKMSDDKVIWVEALKEKVDSIRKRYPNVNVIEACLSDKDDCLTNFMVTNNYESSSILNFKEHLKEHPWVHQIEKREIM